MIMNKCILGTSKLNYWGRGVLQFPDHISKTLAPLFIDFHFLSQKYSQIANKEPWHVDLQIVSWQVELFVDFTAIPIIANFALPWLPVWPGIWKFQRIAIVMCGFLCKNMFLMYVLYVQDMSTKFYFAYKYIFYVKGIFSPPQESLNLRSIICFYLR